MKTRGVQESGRIGKQDRRTETRTSVERRTKKTRASGRVLAMQTKSKVDADGLAVPPYSCCVAFTLIAPEAKHVYVAGSFNDWDAHCTPLTKGINGEWSGYLPLKPGNYEYRFVVDGLWKEDPTARASVPNPFGSNNSVVMVREDRAL